MQSVALEEFYQDAREALISNYI